MRDAVTLFGVTRLFCRALCLAGLALLMGLAVLTTLDGLSRHLLDRPIDLVRDLGGPVSAVAVASCLPVAMIRRSHVTLAVVGGLSARLGRICDLLADGLVLVLLIAMAAAIWRQAASSAVNGDTTWMLQVPLAPFWFACSGIVAIAALAHLAAALERRGRDDAPSAF